VSILEWYFPWSHIDWILKVELLVWLLVIGLSYRIAWRALVRKRPWLQRRRQK
jgi:hypothetical protein